MRGVPFLFLAVSAIFALIGMAWGIQMSASHDHTLAPAHGHLNLIGFVAMAVFGMYYALTPRAATSRLARIHLGLSVAAVLILTPGIAIAISGGTETIAKGGSVLAILTMALFAMIVFRFGVGSVAD